MNKKKIFVGLVIIFTILASATVLYAFTSKINLANLTSNGSNQNESDNLYICVLEKDAIINEMEKSAIEIKANNYIPALLGNTDIQVTSISENNNSEIKTFHDNTINEDYYDIITNNYTISMTEDSNLRAFSDNTFNYDIQTTTDKSVAETFIVNFYNNLDISHDYELAYLEVFDDSMWEADFVKK